MKQNIYIKTEYYLYNYNKIDDLIEEIKIIIQDRDYSFEEVEELKEKIILEGEISNLEGENQASTPLAIEYANLADKFITLLDEIKIIANMKRSCFLKGEKNIEDM